MSDAKRKKMGAAKSEKAASKAAPDDAEMTASNSSNGVAVAPNFNSDEAGLPKSLSHIKNKDRRRENLLKLKAAERKLKIEAKKKKKALEKALGDKAPPKQVRTGRFYPVLRSPQYVSIVLPSSFQAPFPLSLCP